ncbi:peptide ABC transporter substrate-binding protein [Vagococcus hydrophili]|uniref:Peptide ABC transporter substrate-binding protein n=1 Tax=Vagococcus hydrophili TaxID=2714947 RepID=A0A6G8AWQ5_9ENTE|nr:peptide ABC transporter substrate-binding protein [Vagococcus hydrophili]QIL49426.1 peptide ABC transporter substrate-binding protein [Vagococcus hydrophili]
MKKKIGMLLIASVVLLTACGGNKEKEANKDNKNVKQEINVVSSGELSTLDSAFYTDVNSSDMIGQTTEGLYRLNEKGQPELAMAKEEPKVSQDGLVYTFKIREEAKWSNGDAVKASDFVTSFKNVVDPKYGSTSSNQMDIFKNGRSIREGSKTLDEFGVVAKDDQTLELTLEYPIPYLAQVLVGTPFMPKNTTFVKEKGSNYGTTAENFVGNGPFLIKGWNGTNDTWQLEKNPEYWDAKNVKLDKINVQVVKEVATSVQLFEAGDVDYITLADSYAQQYRDSEQATFVPKAMVGYLSPNHKREVTGNVNVRKAFLQAIDKEQFAKDILGDGSIGLNGFIPENFAKDPKSGEDFRKENGDMITFDKKEAKKTWEVAKKELGKDKIELELLSADTGAAKKTIEFVQGQLEQNLPGLKINLKSMPLQNRLDLQNKGEFDLVFGTWTPDYADPINFLEFYDSKSGLNTAKYENTSYDKGLNEARFYLANEPEKRWEKLRDLEKTLVKEDAAVLPLYQGAVGYLKSDRLEGIQVFPFGRTVSYRLAYVK